MRSNASACAALALAAAVLTTMPSTAVVAHARTSWPFDFDHAGVACLDGTELRVITDMRNRASDARDCVNEQLALASLPRDAVDAQVA